VDLREAYRVLEIAEGANEEAVRDARKLLAKVWHPDRHANDPELAARAQHKQSEINSAYEAIRAAQFPTSLPERPAPSRRPPTKPPTPPAAAPPPARIEFVQNRRVRWSVLVLFAIALGAGTYFAITRLGERSAGRSPVVDASTRVMSNDAATSEPLTADAAVTDAPAPPPPASGALRTPGAFRGVELAGALDVEIVIGKPARIEVRGESALLARVSTVVTDGVLVIDAAKGSLPDQHDMHVAITVPDLASLVLSGAGTMRAEGIANEQLEVTVPGSGTLAVAGTTKRLQLVITGPAIVRASELTARTATVKLSGSGTARLVATDHVDARVVGTGTIHVTGNPPSYSRKINGPGLIEIH